MGSFYEVHCTADLTMKKFPKLSPRALMVLGKGKKNCISAPPESHRAPCGNVAAEPSIKWIMPHLFLVNSELESTGCPAVDRTTLIAHISLMPGPIMKPFDSMKVKTGRIFLVYDKSSYWLYYPILGMKMFLTRFSQK